MKNLKVLVKKSALLSEGNLILNNSNYFVELGDLIGMSYLCEDERSAKARLEEVIKLIAREYNDLESLYKYKKIVEANINNTSISDYSITIEIKNL